MIRNKKIIIPILVIAIAAGAVFVGRSAQNKPKESFKEIHPKMGLIQSFITSTGVVQPQDRLEIKPPLNGRIVEILVKEGDKAKAGQIVAWMSCTDRAALLDAARAQSEEVQKYWQTVYKPTPLIAPIDGEVIVSTDKPGQTVTSSDVVMVLSDHLIVQAQVDETDIGRVLVGQEAFISLDAYPEIKIRGTVAHIYYESKTVNNVTIYQVDIVPDTVPPVFRSGMSATATIYEKRKNDILTIPLDVVKRDKDGAFVMIKGKEKKPERRMVVLGSADEKNVEIVSGIDQNDTVMISAAKYSISSGKGAGKNPFMPSPRKKAQ